MTNIIKKPTKYVGLHNHTNYSIGDAIGTVSDHLGYAFKNGSDAMAITDHGNMSGFAQELKLQEAYKKEGKNFKVIFGEEFYFIDSIDDFNKMRLERQNAPKPVKTTKATKASVPAQIVLPNEFEASVDEMKDSSNNVLLKEIEDTTIVENEEETKMIRKFLDPMKQRNHLVLLAKNSVGLKALFKLCSISYRDGFYKFPRIDFGMLKENANGNIIASSACLGSRLQKVISDRIYDVPNFDELSFEELSRVKYEEIQQEIGNVANKFAEVLGGKENFLFEIQFNKLNFQHLLNFHLIHASQRFGFNLVSTGDSHYSDPAHWREREIYKAISRQNKKEEFDVNSLPKSLDELKCELYPKNADEMWQSYNKFCKEKHSFYSQFDDLVIDSIERTHTIAHEVIEKNVLVDKKVKLPPLNKLVLQTKEEMSEFHSLEQEDDIIMKQLINLVKAGMKERGLSSKKEYVDRALKELKVIKHLKLQKYFVTYHKVMEIISNHMLTGNGRGSGVASIVCYLLKITHLDPIKNGLLFERFLSFKKSGMADIDSDSSDREYAVKLITDYFGNENVVPVTNYNQLQLKGLIKDLSKLYGIPFEEVNAVTQLVEKETLDVDKRQDGFDRGVWFLSYESALKNSPTLNDFLEKHPELKTSLSILFKQKKSIGRHAGGVYIGVNAVDAMPLIVAGKGDKRSFQTPFSEGVNLRELEELGFLKFDILGLGTLKIIENTIRRILQKQGIKEPIYKQIRAWHYENIHPDNNEMDDQAVYKNVFWNMNYCSIFQFAERDAQLLMQKLKPTCFNDIVASISINRPGPLSLNVDADYIKNKENPDEIVYAHPLLKECLNDSNGTMLYQEQLQLIYHKLAGLELDDTDAVRKAFTKKEINNKEKAAKDRAKLKEEFLTKCKSVNNIVESVSEKIFEYMSSLVAYTFNKSLKNTTKIDVFTSDGDFIASKQIENIASGDFVKSRDESTMEDCYVKVIDKHDHGVLDLVEVEFDNEHKIVCTLDHKFRVKDGRMLPLWKIRDEDLEVVFDESKKT